MPSPIRIYTVFDDLFLEFASSFINSCRYYSKNPDIVAHLPSTAKKAIALCQKMNIGHAESSDLKLGPKPTSRILKMRCPDCDGDKIDHEPIVYMDIDIVFQGDINTLEDLNPNYIWVLSRREGHQTSLRTWKKHYLRKSTFEYAVESLKILEPELNAAEILTHPVRNCGVLYGKRSLLRKLLSTAEMYYRKLLNINQKGRRFTESDQLCFVLAFAKMQDEIKELPIRFNRMPYHQSYDLKDKSSFFVPDTVALHLNKCKGLGSELTRQWSKNIKPKITVEPNTRAGIVVPIQTSSVAERALTKNLYTLAVANRANVYRDEDVGFIIRQKIEMLDNIRDNMGARRPAFDRGLFFMFNDNFFMIDHGEHTGKRCAWIISERVAPDQLAGVFVEQMDKKTDYSKANIPLVPLSYGAKEPLLWLNQGEYHNLALSSPKKYGVHFLGKIEKNRVGPAKIFRQLPDSQIGHKGNSKRMSFDEYMRDMALAKIAWCPFGNRPKTHREVEAMCAEVAVLMPTQDIEEQEPLIPDVHYICVKPDYSDALEKANYYLKNDDKRAEIARNGRLWYERNTSDTARAKYILDKCLAILSST